MKFGIALTMLQDGLCEGIRLPKWDDSVVIKMQTPDVNSKMTHPYLYVESRYGCVQWKETMVELFAENWELVNPVDTTNIEVEDSLKELSSKIISALANKITKEDK